jgi:hypothetical protein
VVSKASGPGVEDPEDDGKGVDVDLGRVRLVVQDLGGHVDGRAQRGRVVEELLRLLDRPAGTHSHHNEHQVRVSSRARVRAPVRGAYLEVPKSAILQETGALEDSATIRKLSGLMSLCSTRFL